MGRNQVEPAKRGASARSASAPRQWRLIKGWRITCLSDLLSVDETNVWVQFEPDQKMGIVKRRTFCDLGVEIDTKTMQEVRLAEQYNLSGVLPARVRSASVPAGPDRGHSLGLERT